MKVLKLLSKYILNHEEERMLRRVLDIASFDRIHNTAKKGDKVIAVMPTIYQHSGGETSALRILNYLATSGYEVEICCYDNDHVDEMQKNANVNVSGFNGTFVTWDTALNKKYDICIATNWISAYYAKKLSGYKFYFVQDYEPYFTEVGDQFCLAKTTYELGFHIISLGKWNAEQIRHQSKSDSIIDIVDFPFDPNEYTYRKKDFSSYSDKKEITLAVYIRHVGRRIPVITQHLIKKLQIELDKSGITLIPLFYGLNPKDKVFVGKNIGKLRKSELCELYHKADFGMVASITNISLVPMEMHACGLPLIEFSSGSYSSFLSKDTAILIDYDYHTITQKIKYYLENPMELEIMNEKARAEFNKCTWENTCKQFKQVVDQTLGV